jgi:hypothetical protein
MKFLISILAAVSLMVTGVPVIEVNAQVDISNTPDTWLLGTISANSIYQEDFTVTNNGANPVNITISSSNMSGGIPWTLSPTAEPGTDTYGLKASLDGESFDIIVNEDGNPLVNNLAKEGGTQPWSLQFLSPTSFSDGILKSGTVTLTATEG